MTKPPFSENVVLITGASSGIGEHVALRLAEQGAWLALAARNAAQLEEVAAQCRQRGGKAVAIPTDVAEQAQCKSLIERTAAEYGRIDTLINNAGITLASSFKKLQDLTIFEKVVQVNFFGSVYCTFYALPFLKETRGRLAAISSLRGKIPSSRADGYGASKHAMAEFFESIRMELEGSGVSVTIIYPSWVSTGISSRSLRRDGSPTGKISRLEIGAMPVETCARIIVEAVAKRKREVVMTMQGKLALWLMLLAPKIAEQFIRKNMG
jgi:short-subunit dehydrogenase